MNENFEFKKLLYSEVQQIFQDKKKKFLTLTFSTICMEIVLTFTDEILSTFENSNSISSLNAGVFSCMQCSHNQRFRLTHNSF